MLQERVGTRNAQLPFKDLMADQNCFVFGALDKLLTGFISGGGGPEGAFAPPWDPFAPPRNWLFRPFNMGLPLLGFVFAPPPLEFWNLAFAPSETKS